MLRVLPPTEQTWLATIQVVAELGVVLLFAAKHVFVERFIVT